MKTQSVLFKIFIYPGIKRLCYTGLGLPVITDSLANDAALGNFRD